MNAMDSKSENDANKEKREQDCFYQAVALSHKRGGKTEEILAHLNGTPVETRDKNDRPDLTFWCQKSKHSSESVLVGIEHFEINQLSKKHKSSTKSTGREIESRLLRIYDKGHNELKKNDHVSDDNIVSLLGESVALTKEMCLRRYDTFLHTFKAVLDSHCASAGIYRHELRKVDKNAKIELAFLIEVRTTAPQLFLNNGSHVDIKNDGLFPMTEEIVKLLSAVDANLVDYIVLLFHNADFRRNEDVIAIRTGNIKKHLAAQRITTYAYASEDLYGDDIKFEKDTIQRVNTEKIAYQISLSGKSEERIEPLFNALKIAFYAQKNGRPFAASRIVQCMMYAVGEHIQRLEKDGDWYTPIFDVSCPKGDALKRKYDEFDRLYGRIGDKHE